MITLLFFAQLADQAKTRRLQVPFAATPQIVVENLPQGDFLKERTLRVAVNRRWAHWDTPLAENDEVAFLPPLGGIL